jgi:hypothetical protein
LHCSYVPLMADVLETQRESRAATARETTTGALVRDVHHGSGARLSELSPAMPVCHTHSAHHAAAAMHS